MNPIIKKTKKININVCIQMYSVYYCEKKMETEFHYDDDEHRNWEENYFFKYAVPDIF